MLNLKRCTNQFLDDDRRALEYTCDTLGWFPRTLYLAHAPVAQLDRAPASGAGGGSSSLPGGATSRSDLAGAARGSSMTTTSSTRLPEDVRPVHYRLTLEPDLDSFTFVGREEIEVTVESPTSGVTLNASEMNVSRAVAEAADGESEATAIEHDEEQERVTLRFASPLPAGQAVLRLEFTGELNDHVARLLPQLLRGQRRRRAPPRHDAVRGDGRASCVPLLGRTIGEGVRSMSRSSCRRSWRRSPTCPVASSEPAS